MSRATEFRLQHPNLPNHATLTKSSGAHFLEYQFRSQLESARTARSKYCASRRNRSAEPRGLRGAAGGHQHIEEAGVIGVVHAQDVGLVKDVEHFAHGLQGKTFTQLEGLG